jgi:TP901 family phage tail tape measure protein
LASRTAGVGMAGVAMATNQLSRFMYLATQGVKNQQRAFRDLGIDVKRSNGQIKSASEVLLEMADIMPTIENETVRTSLALSTMGRRGADMMSVLMGGADGLKRSIELNARLGLEVSRFSAEMADSIDNNMVIVSSVLDGVQTQIATGFAPAIRDLT